MRRPLTILLLVIPGSAFAQMITENGVIVNQAGDTLRGQISIPRSDKNPNFIDFSQGGVTTRYRPNQIPWFRFGVDASYVGVISEIDMSPKTLKEFDNHSISEGTTVDTVFLSVVVAGKMSLYKLVDDRSNIHYFVDYNNKVTELIVRVRLVNTPSGYSIATQPLYKGQLNSMITGCPQAEPWIEKTSYAQSSLSKLIIKYNSCFGETPGDVQKQSRPRLGISVIGGVIHSSLNNKNSPLTGAPQASYTTSTKGTGALVVEILAPRTRKRFSIVNEFMTYAVEFNAKDPAPASEYFYNLEYFRYNLGGRFYFSGGKLKPYLQTGAGLARAYRTTFFSGTPVNQRFKPGKGEKALHFAAGIKYQRFGIQARYERSTGFSESTGFVTKVTNLSALLTIDLNKPKD